MFLPVVSKISGTSLSGSLRLESTFIPSVEEDDNEIFFSSSFSELLFRKTNKNTKKQSNADVPNILGYFDLLIIFPAPLLRVIIN